MLCPFARGFIKSSTTRVRTFLKPQIFCPYPGVDGPLNHSWECFQKEAFSVSAFTGFVWTKGRIRVKLYAVSKISGCVGKWPYFDRIICGLKHIAFVSYTNWDVKAFLVPDSGSKKYILTFSQFGDLVDLSYSWYLPSSCTPLRTHRIKAISRGFSGGKQLKKIASGKNCGWVCLS